MSQIRVCNRCVMDETATEIEFDKNGICNFCRNYDEVLEDEVHYDKAGEEKIDKLVKKIKSRGKNNKYDCVIGLSGGVDSSYVAYLVKEKYGLRPLAIHLDNGWNTELAVANVENLVKKLDIDLFTHVLDWNEFRDLQLSFLKSSVSNIEIPTDHAIWAILVKTANTFNIPYIIAGNNVVTESIMPESWLYGSKDSKLIRAIQKKFGTVKLKNYPTLSLMDYIRYFLIGGIRWIPILNYIPFNKNSAKQMLMKDYAWQDYGGKHYESIFTRYFHAGFLPLKFGYDLRKSYLSALICSEQISRDSAMKELKNPPASEEVINGDIQYVAKKLRLSSRELENIMSLPKKTFRDYPNNDHIWRKMRFFVKIARNLITKV